MIYNYFPENIRHIIKHAIKYTCCLEEIRVRCGQRVVFSEAGDRYYVDINGNLTRNKDNVIVIDKRQLFEMIQLITQNSVYAVQDEIKNGFITLKDGSRIGICGKCVTVNGQVEYIKEISSINIRVAREVKGCAEKIYAEIYNNDKNFLIISPPGQGKTTFLRDFIRLASDGGKNVSVVDERCELAPVFDGKHIYDMGNNTDILSGLPKALGIDMVLRTMNPQVIAVDEIATSDDFEAVTRAANSGVKIFATFHGNTKEDFFKKLNSKYDKKYLFDNYIYIRRSTFSNREVYYE